MSKKLNKNLPQLRFPEFEGDWQPKTLGELAEWSSGGTPSKDNSDYWGGAIPWISASSMYDDILLSSDQRITQLGLENGSKLATKGSILILVRGMMLYKRIPIGIAGRDLAFNQDIKCLNIRNKRELPFLFYWFKSKENLIKSLVSSTNVGTGKLDISQLKRLVVVRPLIAEQEKIASLLGAVDRRLTQLRRKQELLQTYKRGVMQKIFSQKIRFKDAIGSPFPDWKRKKLSDIAKPIKRTLEFEKELPVMSISAGFGFLDQKERFNQVIAGSSLDKYTLIHKGEFSYNRGASKAFPYGCIYLMKEYEEALIPFVYRTFQLTHGVKSFFAQYFLTGILDRQLRKLISSSARMDGLLNIGEKDFYTLSVPFPVENEQEKITNFIAAIDHKIETLSRQIEQTEKFKKGSLQKLFI
ncbi:restriction endonuclease subunit S [Nostoc sp. CENA67]|uniref:Restriction endonuclease subunit S n=1 Tax=Amazonocrinis nigriterrae CENA67 TaxID=2794033 RepID=A0A8J7LB76_9NOST|nr:restriction endonuclease subunit S [Amazonocrinis nigriterrae]MBH8565480.1 restriction endonuclease subunit S [Amazonocrinis nigriterrae CENA67]